MPGPDIGGVLAIEDAIEGGDIDSRIGPDSREGDTAPEGRHPLQQRLAGHPCPHPGNCGHQAGLASCQPGVGAHHGLERDGLVQHAATDADLFLRTQEEVHEARIARDGPADPDAREAEAFRQRTDADRPGAQSRSHRRRRDERHVAVGLVDQEIGAARLSQGDHARQGLLREGYAGRVVRRGEADQSRGRPHPGRQGVHIQGEGVVEFQVEAIHLAAHPTRRGDVGGVVGTHNDHVIARIEQRDRHDEERRRCSGREQHVVRAKLRRRPPGDQGPQIAIAQVIAVAERQRSRIEAELAQRAVTHGGFCQVEPYTVITELLGRFRLDGHAGKAHQISFFRLSANAYTRRDRWRQSKGPASAARICAIGILSPNFPFLNFLGRGNMPAALPGRAALADRFDGDRMLAAPLAERVERLCKASTEGRE